MCVTSLCLQLDGQLAGWLADREERLIYSEKKNKNTLESNQGVELECI